MTALKILHLDSSILAGSSASRALSAQIVERLKQAHTGSSTTYRDLAAHPLSHLSGAVFTARQSDAVPPPDIADDVTTSRQVLQEYLAADVIVVGVGFYNFNISSQLKAWVDSIMVAGKTFRYTPDGARPIAGGKRIFLAIARGGFYGAGTPYQPFEHAETYLRQVFGFLGDTSVEVIVAEGLSVNAESRQTGIARAAAGIAALSL